MNNKYSQRIFALLLFFLIFAIPLVYSYYTRESFEATKFVFLLLTDIFLFIFFIKSPKNIKITIYHTLFTMLLVLGALTLLWAHNIYRVLWYLLIRFNILALSIIIYNQVCTSRKVKYKLEFLAFAVSIVVSVIGILQVLGIDYSEVLGSGRIFSTVSNPNFLSNYLLIIGLYGAVAFIERKNFFALVSSSFSLITIILAQTRGAILGFVFAITLYIILRRKKQVLLLFLMVAALLWFGRAKIIERFSGKIMQGNSEYRIFIWNTAFSMTAHHPFGTGLDNFNQLYPYYQAQYRRAKVPVPFGVLEEYVHNEFIQAGTGGGILYLSFALLILVLFIKRFKKSSPAHIAIAGFLFHSLFSFPFHLPVSLVYFAFISSLEQEPQEFNLNARYLLPAFLILAALTLYFAPRFFLWQTWYKTAKYYESAGQLRKSNVAYTNALKYGTKIGELNHDYGVVLEYLGKWQKAKKYFVNAIKYNPSDTAKINLGNCMFKTGNFNAAYLYYKQGLAIRADNVNARKNLDIVRKYIRK